MAFYNPLDAGHPSKWPNYKLLIPLCAVGNVGQLACDLIISTLLKHNECQLVGRIYSPALMPVVGPNAYSPHGHPTTSTEVYESTKHKLVIIQQRTSYFKNLKQLYIDQLLSWIKESQFCGLIVLSSSFAQSNPDTSQLGCIGASPLRYITTSSFRPCDNWKSLDMKPIPDKKSLKVVKDGLTYLPGSGMTKSLRRECERAQIPAAFLIDFCSEGINITDCYQVVNVVGRLLNLNKLETNTESIEKSEFSTEESHSFWVEPYSWSQV